MTVVPIATNSAMTGMVGATANTEATVTTAAIVAIGIGTTMVAIVATPTDIVAAGPSIATIVA